MHVGRLEGAQVHDGVCDPDPEQSHDGQMQVPPALERVRDQEGAPEREGRKQFEANVPQRVPRQSAACGVPGRQEHIEQKRQGESRPRDRERLPAVRDHIAGEHQQNGAREQAELECQLARHVGHERGAAGDQNERHEEIERPGNLYEKHEQQPGRDGPVADEADGKHRGQHDPPAPPREPGQPLEARAHEMFVTTNETGLPALIQGFLRRGRARGGATSKSSARAPRQITPRPPRASPAWPAPPRSAPRSRRPSPC